MCNISKNKNPMNKLLFSLFLISSLSLFCSEQEAPQRIVMKLDAINSLQDVAQYEAQCYSHDYTAFHEHDLPQATNSSSDAKNATAIVPIKKSLYAQFDNLPLGLQDHIMSYLKKADFPETTREEKFKNGLKSLQSENTTTNLCVMIDDKTWKEEHKKQFKTALKSWQPKDLPFIKDFLRTEYWLRYVARARGLHPMTKTNRMVPFELSRNKYSQENILDQPSCNTYPAHNLEIATLMIYCGALVNIKKKINLSPLATAIKEDNIPMIKLLIKAGLTQPYGSESLLKLQTAPHIAAENNALNALRYLHSIGYNLNAKDNKGFTPLHAAHYYAHNEAIQLLLSLGANPHIKDNYGELYKNGDTHDKYQFRQCELYGYNPY